ncbi:MAG: sn-glycerol-3-phosphate ABC transporter ATP-binding protein UgpC [Phycisphaerales bacterium]|jgi:multiple sugar transport system ATP-binding protein|nr:sn-glycerol-3-phosphate ABC transporter ATP-binding protein UgpC [Phycisphaerales bacterium]
MARVSFKDVRKVYPGGHEAVKSLSLDIADGEFVVLVGPSGCGKSTTLRMLAGLEEVSNGSISIDDSVVNNVLPRDRDIAMVFQSYALYPHMSVYDNMAFALKMRKTPREEIHQRVTDAARMLGLTDLLKRKPRQLSGGQRQRVAVGRAIVRKPKAFLFDEPLSNLDAKLRVTTRAELKHLHQRLRTTTVYVTHDQEEAMTLGDRIVVMAEGIIQQSGPPLTLYHHPANRFVAAFIGMPPMNFVEGQLVRENGSLWFASSGDASVRLRIDPSHDDALASHAGQPITLGLRPQAMHVAQGEEIERARADGTLLSARAEVVEPLGDQSDAFLSLPSGARLVARVDAARTPRPGDTVHLRVDAPRAHLFEPGAFGRTLTRAHD